MSLEGTTRDEIVKVFKKHDTEEDGKVSRQVLLKALQRLARAQSKQEMDPTLLNKLLDAVEDPPGGGRIPYEAFLAMIFAAEAPKEEVTSSMAGIKAKDYAQESNGNAEEGNADTVGRTATRKRATEEVGAIQEEEGATTSFEEYIGHEFRAVSVHYWSVHIIAEAEAAMGEDGKNLTRDAKVYEIEPAIIRPKGKDVICPRSVAEGNKKMGAAYVDCVTGIDNVGLAAVMLSYTWGYTIGDIASGLEEYCKQRNLNPKRIYSWICCLCINQHRVKEAQARKESIPFEEFRQAFSNRVSGVGRIVALMTPWRNPHYIKRVWCDFELYTCMMNKDKDCQVSVTMPAAQKEDLIQNLCSGLGVDEMWKALADLDVRQAEASYPEDKEMIMKIIRESKELDFHVVNSTCSKYLQSWIVKTCEEHLRTKLEATNTTVKEKVMLLMNVGSLLRKIGRDDMSDRAAAHLSAANEALTTLEKEDPANVPDVYTRVKLLHQLGCAQLQQSHKDEAGQSFATAVQYVREHDLLKSSETVELLMDRGAFFRKYKENKKATQCLDEAQAICDEIGDKVSKLTRAQLMMEIGNTKRRDKDYLPALVDLRKVQKLYEEIGCMNTPEGAELLAYVGVTLAEYNREAAKNVATDEELPEAVGQERDPLDVYKYARHIRELTSTLESPGGAKLLASMGAVHSDRKEWVEAKKLLEHAKQVYELTDSLETPMGAFSMWSLGDAYAGTGAWSTAWNAYERARLIYEKCGTLDKRKDPLIESLNNAKAQKGGQNLEESEPSKRHFGGQKQEVEVSDAGLKVMQWNIATINTNPFEYWMTLDDQDYAQLMGDFEDFIQTPGDRDIPLHQIFPDSLFLELLDLMTREASGDKSWKGMDFVKSEWDNFRELRIISGFIKNKDLANKRLFSMPDMATSRINVVGSDMPAYRPSVVNHYTGDLRRQDEWWLRWRNYMFHEALTLKGGDVKRPVQMLTPLNRERYTNKKGQCYLSEKEAEASVPLQLLSLALYDAVLVHIMNSLRPQPDHTWQNIKRKMTMVMAKRKLKTTLAILRTTYSTTDVICMQKVSAIYKKPLESSLGTEFNVIFPGKTDPEDAAQSTSVILLRRKVFAEFDLTKPAHADLTQTVIDLAAPDTKKKKVGWQDLLVISTVDRSGRPYLIASFHSDGDGLQSKPIVSALATALTKQPEKCRAIFGLDANTVLKKNKPGLLDVEEFSEHCKEKGLRTCSDKGVFASWTTTCKARTFLQPQIQKAVPKTHKLSDDVNPRDHILVQRKVFEVMMTCRDNTGKLDYIEAHSIPSMEFPSDHAIVSAVLEPYQEPQAEVEDAVLDDVRDKLLMAFADGRLEQKMLYKSASMTFDTIPDADDDQEEDYEEG